MYLGCRAKTKDQKGCEEFKYLGVKIDKEDRQENYIKKIINKGWAITAVLNSLQITMAYGTRRFNAAFTRALQ